MIGVVIWFFRMVIWFCVFMQLSRGYMLLWRGYLVHLRVYMVFRGYMTFPRVIRFFCVVKCYWVVL